MTCRPISQNQKLLPIRSIHNYKIIFSTKNFQDQIWRSNHSIKGYQLWNSTRQRARTGALSAIHCRSFNRLAYHNCNLCGRHSYLGGSQKLYRSISVFTRKPFLHSEITKEMENQSQWAKSVQVTFSIRGETCPPVILNGLKIPQAEDAKYLELHLDRRLNWRKHIFTKRK